MAHSLLMASPNPGLIAFQNLPVEDRGEDICMPQCFFLQETKFLGRKGSVYRDPTGEGARGTCGHKAVSGRIGNLSPES